tara:strand:+ start:242 stop:358 length:117 start_codon:yes stop_codon:yes gene_type:complete
LKEICKKIKSWWESLTTPTTSIPLKKDGTPDKRYKRNK